MKKMIAKNRDSHSLRLSSMTPSTTMIIYKISKLAKNLWLDKGTQVVEERKMTNIKSQTIKI